VPTEYQTRKFTLAFELLDTDRNAFVEASDLARVATRLVTRLGLDEGSEEHRVLAGCAAALWEVLRQVDRDGDGRLDPEEWLRALAELAGSGPSHEHLFADLLDQSFELLDTDADGAVSCAEFALWLGATGLGEDVARRTFESCDLDGDGLLSKSEVGFLLLDFFYGEDPETRGSWLLEL
jgi:Ca2+-binding EF-hand superfamily protein